MQNLKLLSDSLMSKICRIGYCATTVYFPVFTIVSASHYLSVLIIISVSWLKTLLSNMAAAASLVMIFLLQFIHFWLKMTGSKLATCNVVALISNKDYGRVVLLCLIQHLVRAIKRLYSFGRLPSTLSSQHTCQYKCYIFLYQISQVLWFPLQVNELLNKNHLWNLWTFKTA